jgi:DNA (cytosine-5)-methyltransferase 1
MAMREPRVIDLCWGIGGMTLAFRRAGYRCVFASEIDEAAGDVYEANHGFRPAGDPR